MTSNDDYVLQVLQEQGMVTPELIDQAAMSLKQEGETVVDQLVKTGVVTEEDLLHLIASQFGMEVVSIDPSEINPDLKTILSSDDARKYGVVPLVKNGDTLTVAMSDPLNYDTLDRLRSVLKCNVEGVVAPRKDVAAALDALYPGESDMESLMGELDDGDVDLSARSLDDQLGTGETTETDAPVIKLVSLIIMEAFRRRASDIHLEPLERRFRVRYRIDGALQEMEPPPKRLQSAILQRVKIMSGMKISEKRVPQDGRIQVNVQGRDLDLRVSSVPTNHGESIVMRILDKQNLALGLPQLGFLSDDQQRFERLIALPDGVLLVTGPTGSGKTTTLYACLGQINQPDRKIITVEDPVEYQMSGVNQVQVNRDVGLDFAAALRSILRQAPNIVMIGEIRDEETADIAMEAALTGHLVFSTLHTNDAPSAITRLLDIGVKPYLVASAVQAAMAQRLVRCICQECKEQRAPTERELKMLGPAAARLQQATLWKGRGCPACSLTGYKGRKGIFEIFPITDAVQRMIFDQRPANELRISAREAGMRTLREDGLLKVASGMTTLDEVLRATMGDAD
ncbi:MAG: ATPase, T2SS/T4P/T4SS family [Kiritimatiellae bacterium]|nr:ATPase, T2SS/T4P/T4SS family [Kiritimatiellia bacterium]